MTNPSAVSCVALTVTMVGEIGIWGCQIRRATSIFDFTISQAIQGIYPIIRAKINNGRSLLSTTWSLEVISAANMHEDSPNTSISGSNMPLQSSQSTTQSKNGDKNRFITWACVLLVVGSEQEIVLNHDVNRKALFIFSRLMKYCEIR